jgi:hypothetical protein
MTPNNVGESRQLRKYYRDEIEKLGLVRPMAVSDIDQLKGILKDTKKQQRVERAVNPVKEPDPKVQQKLFKKVPNSVEKGEVSESYSEDVEVFWNVINEMNKPKARKSDSLIHDRGGSDVVTTVIPSGSTYVHDGRGLFPKESFEDYKIRKAKSRHWRF